MLVKSISESRRWIARFGRDTDQGTHYRGGIDYNWLGRTQRRECWQSRSNATDAAMHHGMIIARSLILSLHRHVVAAFCNV